ncbi:MAG: integrase [Deltaproteobacteria bacterium]|nr:MAG: integrase [Deltaproteobacteria bacterium]
MPLTDTKIRNTKPSTKPIKLTDSNGLLIEIKPNGNKYWRYRYRIAGKENLYAIGQFTTKLDPNHISLATARTLRDEARKLVKQGIHPAHHRKAELGSQIEANENTFKAVAELWFDYTRNRKGWTENYAKQVKTVLEGDVWPIIGNLPIGFVAPHHIATILEHIEQRKANTVAILARQWCSAVFRYAIRKRKATSDPTVAFKGEITRPDPQHSKPLPRKEIPVFLRKLDKYQGYRETVIALKLLMLTLARTKELREATWDEFDLESAIWRIPAQRMKMRREHIVPLSNQAVELLTELHTRTDTQKWLFPNRRSYGKCMSATSLNRAIEYLGYAGRFSCHGFRSTASTQLNEYGYRSDVIEKALAHAERNLSRKPYNQAEYLQERKEMLQDWADFLDCIKEGKAKINPICKRAEKMDNRND